MLLKDLKREKGRLTLHLYGMKRKRISFRLKIGGLPPIFNITIPLVHAASHIIYVCKPFFY